MGGEQNLKVPDYRIYKVEGVPQLEKVQRLLAARGLKDPWLRNEVWRYTQPSYLTPGNAAKATIFRGFKWGFGAFVLTILAEKMYKSYYPDTHHGSDHH